VTVATENAPLDAPESATRRADEASAGSGRGAWRALAVQPLLVAVGLLAFVLWRLNASLTETEARQLGWTALWRSTREHLLLTVTAAVIVLVIAVPLGIALTRRPLRRLSPVITGVANTGQAAPAIGLFVLLATWLGFGFRTTVVALVVYAALPVLRNTLVGIQGVDPRLVEAGRGMGMSAAAVLFRVELPLAVPVILAGLRVATVSNVSLVSVGALLGVGGLGALFTDGLQRDYLAPILVGIVLSVALALLLDTVIVGIQRVLTPWARAGQS